MKATATVLANNILVRARRENIQITPMKLQKLLYYVCVKYVKEVGDSPISEQFEVWPYGPVLPSVYFTFKSFRSSPIKGFARDAGNEIWTVNEDANPILTDCINYVWTRLKNYSGVDLSRMTHQRGSGWYSAYQDNRSIISKEEMKADATFGERSS